MLQILRATVNGDQKELRKPWWTVVDGFAVGWSWGEEVDEEAEEVDDEAEEVDDAVEEGDDGTRLGAWWEWGALALGRELRTARRLEPS